MTNYRLQSSPMVCTPGLIAWAINGYAFEKDRDQLVKTITEAFPSLPAHAAISLLSDKIEYSAEDEAVVFTVNHSESHLYTDGCT